ncbi:hypothetical protein [Vibrio phage LP.2]|nr:hypothetical protein [Vibrio phage LP.2]
MKLEDYIKRVGWSHPMASASRRCNSLEEYARKNMTKKHPLDVTKPWIERIYLFMKAANRPCTIKEICRGSGKKPKDVYAGIAMLIRYDYQIKKTPLGKYMQYHLVV